jgi:hypothetical protein
MRIFFMWILGKMRIRTTARIESYKRQLGKYFEVAIYAGLNARGYVFHRRGAEAAEGRGERFEITPPHK